MTARVLAGLVACALALGLGASRARAEDPDTRASRLHYQKAEKLFALGRFDEALVEYEKAYERKPLPKMLFNIAQCHRNLHHYQEAIFSYRKYLRLVPDADNKDDVETTIAELEDKQAAEERDAARVAIVPPARPERPPPPHARPIYARWWFWGGVAAVAGASTGAYFLFRGDGIPSTDLGNVTFH